ncbi:patatin-like phospholipase family protein [Gordonia soli]|uniref:PNPLA domain-containing protein n=1 Tax=Gordonia soli NBRC 108243 TaxID=1223545 RepID=M0QIX8_9ACTN|nr:hypothetical protein [Gordonia soli]GAC68384.1 hypothetical protein GS4_15_00330 [Gordonia soli NBRC 108243]
MNTSSVTDSIPAGQPAVHPSAAPGSASGASSDGRALVLGGGGSTGNAWLIGVVAGLADVGLDVTTAALSVGTSAGATAVAQFAGATAAELFEATQVAPPAPQRDSGHRGGAPGAPASEQLTRLRALIATAVDPDDMRRRVGAAAMAREAESDGSWSERWRGIVAPRLPDNLWPVDRAMAITAVDAETGEPIVFDARSGVDLVDAVAASCSGGGLPYRIGDRWYVDGGYRRNENADLATGFGRVLVLSPLGGRTLHPLDWRMQLAAQVEELRATGARVEIVVPDAESECMFGANAMDLSLRPAAARAGRTHGRALAGRLGEFWSAA